MPKRAPQVGDIVEIKWHDATSQDGWADLSETKKLSAVKCLSWGKVIEIRTDKQGRKEILICGDYIADPGNESTGRRHVLRFSFIDDITVLKRSKLS